MANNRMHWTGLRELKEYLRTLPDHLTNEATGIVHGSAQQAYTEIYNAYPEVTGNLRSRLTLSLGGGMKASSRALGANAVLYNNAKHAWIYDNGTAQRRNRFGSTGQMFGRSGGTPTHLFVKTAAKWRRSMYERLMFMLRREGFKVSGSIDAAA